MLWKSRPKQTGALTLVAMLTLVACSSPGAEPDPGRTVDVADATVNDARYQCLLDQGIPVTRGEGGAVDFSDPTGTLSERWEEAEAYCKQELVDAGLIEEVTDESLRAEYVKLAALHECLVENDFPVVAWPSENVFVEEKGTFNALEATVPIDLDNVRAACPDQMSAIDAP